MRELFCLKTAFYTASQHRPALQAQRTRLSAGVLEPGSWAGAEAHDQMGPEAEAEVADSKHPMVKLLFLSALIKPMSLTLQTGTILVPHPSPSLTLRVIKQTDFLKDMPLSWLKLSSNCS